MRREMLSGRRVMTDTGITKDILPAGGTSEVLQAKINLPEDYKDSFNVIVVQECTPVQY